MNERAARPRLPVIPPPPSLLPLISTVLTRGCPTFTCGGLSAGGSVCEPSRAANTCVGPTNMMILNVARRGGTHDVHVSPGPPPTPRTPDIAIVTLALEPPSRAIYSQVSSVPDQARRWFPQQGEGLHQVASEPDIPVCPPPGPVEGSRKLDPTTPFPYRPV